MIYNYLCLYPFRVITNKRYINNPAVYSYKMSCKISFKGIVDLEECIRSCYLWYEFLGRWNTIASFRELVKSNLEDDSFWYCHETEDSLKSTGSNRKKKKGEYKQFAKAVEAYAKTHHTDVIDCMVDQINTVAYAVADKQWKREDLERLIRIYSDKRVKLLSTIYSVPTSVPSYKGYHKYGRQNLKEGLIDGITDMIRGASNDNLIYRVLDFLVKECAIWQYGKQPESAPDIAPPMIRGASEDNLSDKLLDFLVKECAPRQRSKRSKLVSNLVSPYVSNSIAPPYAYSEQIMACHIGKLIKTAQDENKVMGVIDLYESDYFKGLAQYCFRDPEQKKGYSPYITHPKIIEQVISTIHQLFVNTSNDDTLQRFLKAMEAYRTQPQMIGEMSAAVLTCREKWDSWKNHTIKISDTERRDSFIKEAEEIIKIYSQK